MTNRLTSTKRRDTANISNVEVAAANYQWLYDSLYTGHDLRITSFAPFNLVGFDKTELFHERVITLEDWLNIRRTYQMIAKC
jgi:hypothetical protein